MAYEAILAVFLLISPSLGFYTFRTKIPNGEIVPHPCKANYMWGGVGHLDPAGGGPRNAFGKDFQNAGAKWTQELCRFDSDGDGMTNGQELGDPNCSWTEGSIPERVTDISHPGVCDPYGQGVCAGRDSFVDCSIETFGESCDIIKQAEVQSVDLRFQKHTLPATETNYYCQYFDLPSTQDYHIVADEGLIDNRNVLHHMILYGCPDDYKSSPTDDYPNPCSMSSGGDSCSVIIALWTVGLPGTCYGDDYGFRIGATGYKKVKLEIHYNNPMLVSGYTDMTGIRLFYRNVLPGVQDLATFTVGQMMLDIPPGKEMVEARGSCPSDCTIALISKPMYIVSSVNHMHYMGRSQRTEVIRDGRVIKVLADDPQYNYDSPVPHDEETPFQVLPGDEIATTCKYSSLSKKRHVYFGEGTSDEMCFAFLTVYPADALPFTMSCSSIGPLSPCDLHNGTPKMGCDWARFGNVSNPEMLEHYTNLRDNCNLDGLCRSECKELVEGMMDHPCLENKQMNSLVTRFLGQYKEGVEFLGRLHSCSGHHGDTEDKECHQDCSKCDVGDWDTPANSGSPLTSQVIVMVMATLLLSAMY